MYYSNQILPELKSFTDVAEIAHNEQLCRNLFAKWRWNDNIVCPHCKHDKVYTFKDGEYYKCAKCRQKFTVKVGTVFEGSNIKLGKWLLAIYLITSHKKGISSCQLAKDIKVTQKTAWFLLHRVKIIMCTESFKKSEGLSLRTKKILFELVQKEILSINSRIQELQQEKKNLIYALDYIKY